MKKRSKDQLEEDDESIPLSIQTFFWRQTSPFIRPRLGKKQDTQISMEQQETCKSYEKVLVQDLCFGLAKSLTDDIQKISRWKLIQSALPYVVHCCSTLLYRKNHNLNNLGASETKLLYTLHWIILYASEECIDSELEKNIKRHPDYYLLPVTTIELFIFQFAPLISYLKKSEFLKGFRLENGYKLWGPLFRYEHPDIPSFIKHVKPRKSILNSNRNERSAIARKLDTIFIGESLEKDDKFNFINDFDPDSIDKKNSLATSNNFFNFDSFQKTSINNEQTANKNNLSKPDETIYLSKDQEVQAALMKVKELSKGAKIVDPSMATYLDVAVLRCLFASQWLEEGIYWALVFFEKRLIAIKKDMNKIKFNRQRSNSLPNYRLESMIISLADCIKERKANKADKDKSIKNSNESNFNTTNTSSNIVEELAINVGSNELSVRRNSYTPSNVSGAEFPETKNVKFKKQRTEEQLMNGSCKNCGTICNEELAKRNNCTNQSFLSNLKYDIQKFGQKKKPKSNALSAIKKDHQKYRPIRCSSCDVLDLNSKSCKKNNVALNNISATYSQTIMQNKFSSSPIKTSPNITSSTSIKPSIKDQETQVYQNTHPQLLKLKKSLLRGTSEPTLTQQEITEQKTQNNFSEIKELPSEHLAAEKRNSNESSSSTDTSTVGSTTTSISIVTTTTASGSISKDVPLLKVEKLNNEVQSNLNIPDPMNPVITVTEHSPNNSSKHFFIGSSIKNKNNDQSSFNLKEKIPQNDKLVKINKSVKRRLTDTTVNYNIIEIEALGTLNYITKTGQLCLLVILKAVHNISVRENVCTSRVSESLVKILKELIELGLLEHLKIFNDSVLDKTKSSKKNHKVNSKDEFTVFHLFLDTCMNVFKSIGCEYGCNRQTEVCDVSKTRNELHSLLKILFLTDQNQFKKYFQEMVCLKQLSEIMEIFHSYLGFCRERSSSTDVSRESSKKPMKKNLSNHQLLPSSSLNVNKQSNLVNTSKSKDSLVINNSDKKKEDKVSKLSVFNNKKFLSTTQMQIESYIIECTFSPFIDRLIVISNTLNLNENFSTFSDIRQMVIFIKTYHVGPFRKITLNALLNSAELFKKKLMNDNNQIKLIDKLDDNRQNISDSLDFCNEDNHNKNNLSNFEKRNSFFKVKNIKKIPSNQSMVEEENIKNELNKININDKNILIDSFPQLKNYSSNETFKEKEEKFYSKNLLFENFKPITLNDFEKIPSSSYYSSTQILKNSKFDFWLKTERHSYLKNSQNNENENQTNSDGVFIFSANSANVSNYYNTQKDENMKIFTVGGFNSTSSYTGNTLAIGQDTRRSSFQSRTYSAKSSAFITDLNTKPSTSTTTENKKALEDQFFKLHLISKRSGKMMNNTALPGMNEENNGINTMNHVSSSNNINKLIRKNSLGYLDGGINSNYQTSGNYRGQLENNQSKEIDFLAKKRETILSLNIIKNGILKFSFLLESCPPGSLPDAPLIAAVLKLKCPVIARAAFYFELANFIHECNLGNWPKWMKQNFPLIRNSESTIKPFSNQDSRNLNQNNNLKRYAGRMFYLWGEAISSYLEELLIKEKFEEENSEQIENSLIDNQNEDIDTDDAQSSVTTASIIKHNFKKPKSNKDEENFLNDKTVNPDGNNCPFALKIAAVSVLHEITTFLRETHQSVKLDKNEKMIKKNAHAVSTNITSTNNSSTNHGVNSSSIAQNSNTSNQAATKLNNFASLANQVIERQHSENTTTPTASIVTKPLMTASRRWSMAFSNLGLSHVAARGLKNHASSSKDISNNKSNSTVTQSTYNHNERRISFVISEAEGENSSEQSSNATVIHEDSNQIGHQQILPIKRLSQSNTLASQLRPNLLTRRSTGSQSLASGQNMNSIQQENPSNQGNNNSSNGSSGSFKRRSIHLKRDPKAKRSSTLAEDFEESDELGDEFNRSDSLKSKRKVSGISEKSDTSERADHSGDESPGALSTENQHLAPNSTKDTSFLLSFGKIDYFNVLDQDDSRICQNMPWLKVVSQILMQLDFSCKHNYGCSKNCYKKKMISCSKLSKAVHLIFKSENRKSELKDINNLINSNVFKSTNNLKSIYSGPNSGFATSNFPFSENQKKNDKKIKQFYGNGTPIKRKESMNQFYNRIVDRDSLHLNPSVHGSNSFLPHLETETGNLNILSSQQSDPQKAYLEANRQRLIQKYYLKNSKIKIKSLKSDPKNSEEEVIEKMAKFLENFVRNLFHMPMSLLLKGFLILPDTIYSKLLHTSWNLILEDDQHLSCTAACAFILCSFKCVDQATELLNSSLNSSKPKEQINSMRKFQIIWKFRYQCWPRMEENAAQKFKLPPPMIEFTLPSPKIALSSMPVASPPWLPKSKYKVEEVTLNQEQTLQKSFVTATKTRRKQQIEMIKKAFNDQQEKLRVERENYVLSSVAIANEASYEPALHRAEEHEEDPEELGLNDRLTHHLQVAQPMFTSALCSASLTIINLLNSSQVNDKGNAVYEMAYKVIWYCLVEDTSLFLRNLFEKLTKENGKYILQILRRLIRFMPRLPAQAAFSLYNYLIGFIMYHVRTPAEGSQELIGTTLSVLWLVVPSVHGLFLKGLKQVLRKEQCDAHILITANVPSTKKIIVHGPDSSAIPSQFNVQEDTQFAQILIESLNFFSIDEKFANEFYLLDSKSNQIHNLNAFVRDFYFFKRSQYPQLTLTKMNPEKAAELLQKQALCLQFTELGKVLMSLSIVNTPHLATQRVLFLHEELMKLPAFPRKALESNFQLHHNGLYGKELTGMDTLHKLVWVKLVARMLEVTSGFFAQSGDIHLFLNVVNGALILHCEDASVLRLCMATYINAAHQFKNIFNTNGYLLIMPTILRIYSNHQTNALLCKTVEFVCKQFYIMHRKPFILQMFGSSSTILDLDSNHNLGDASKVQPKAFFQLLQSMGLFSSDPMQILDLVHVEKPLRALDFCYLMDTDNISIKDSISICVTVIGYAADSQRAFQMLTILEAILPLYMKYNQSLTMRKEQPGQPKNELETIINISACIKTLISNCEALTRNFTGPQRAIDLRSSSIKNASKGAYSPMDIDEDSHSNPTNGPTGFSSIGKNKTGLPQFNYSNSSGEDNEALRAQFRQPRDTLLNVVCEYLTRSTARLAELSKKIPDLHPSKSGMPTELLDVKCHFRLAEIAHSLLKVAPYDPQTMACKGLIRYMNEILPTSEWRQEAMRPALITILRRLDKMFNKIAKKNQIRKWTDWDAARKLLKGIFSTFLKHPYIVHLPHLKSLISVCQYIVLGDNMTSNSILNSGNTNVLSGVGLTNNGLQNTNSAMLQPGGNTVIVGIGNLAQASSNTAGLTSILSSEASNQLSNINSWTTALAQSPPAGFCSVVVRLIALQILQLSENQTLETICSGIFSNNIEKTEIYLMNMIYPMCIRISGSIREVPKLRPCDITLILSAILNTLNPNTTKTQGNLGTGWQTGAINKSISTNTLHQIGFLGLKIMIACFERQLSNDWHRIAKCIREIINKNSCSSLTNWKFFDFIVTYRTPLFILLLPIIKHKLLLQSCENEHESFYQQQILEKLQGKSMPQDRSKGKLLVILLNELKTLKEDLINKRVDEVRKTQNVSTNNNLTTNNLTLANATNRLSFALNQNRLNSLAPSAPPFTLSPDENENKTSTINRTSSNNSSLNIQSNSSTPNRMKSLLNRGISFRSSISSQSSDFNRTPHKAIEISLSEKTRGLSVRIPDSNIVKKFFRRTSYPYNVEESSSQNLNKVDDKVKLETSKCSNEKQNENTNVEATDNSNEESKKIDDDENENLDKSKLQRQKAQSKKMLNNRRSKKKFNTTQDKNETIKKEEEILNKDIQTENIEEYQSSKIS